MIDEAPGVCTDPPNPKKLNFHAVLADPPKGFTGFATDESVLRMLTADMWEDATSCLLQGGWPETRGYYAIAFWLQGVSSLLGSLSFGRVLGIVRLCSRVGQIVGHR